MHATIHLCLAALIVLLSCSSPLLEGQAAGNYAVETAHRRFEYKYSFKGPYLAQKDGTVPFWEYSGASIASEEMVRITPSLRSKKGQIWTRAKTTFNWWEVELMFRVNGKGRIGADGLAFWYTDVKYPEGPVFGSADHWQGLALFFDSFDNDNKGNNPYVMAMVNDGTKSYDHNTDGINQQLQGCLRDFRNKPFPVRAKIEYYKNVLTVMFHSGNTNNEHDYELCLRAENVFLPPFGHFGISAATGGLADDHDVLKFLTYSLVPQSQVQAAAGTGGLSDADKQRFSAEYEQYKTKLERQRDDYLKAHPDEAKRLELESDKAAESEFDFSVRELQQIYQGQSEVFDNVKAMHHKLDEIIGRQERALSLITSIQAMGGGGTAAHGGGVQPAPVSRQEVESILSVQRELLTNAREIKVLVQHNTGGGQQQPPQPPQQHQPAQGGSQDGNAQQLHLLQQLLTEVRENMNVVRREFGTLTTRLAGGTGGQAAGLGTSCPTLSCTSSTTLLLFLAVQSVILVGTLYFLNHRESSQSKKFY